MTWRALQSVLLVLLLWFAGLGAAGQFAKIAVPFAEFQDIYDGSSVGWLLSIVSVMGILLGTVASVLAARFGFVRLLVLALVLGAAMSLWQTSLPALPLMLISRLIEGLSHLTIVVVAPTLIARISSDQFRGMAMTLWSTFFGVAFAVIAWVGLPYVAQNGLPALLYWHGMYMALMALLLVGGFALLGRKFATSDTPLSLKAVLQQHVDTYSSPTLSAPAFGWLFYTMTFVSLLAILPSLLPEDSRAALAGLMPLISIATSLGVVSVLLVRLSGVAIVKLGFLLSALTVVLYLFGLPAPVFALALFAVFGLVQGASFAAVPQLNHTGEDQAMANGAMAQMGNLGNTLGTPVLLMIAAMAGQTAMFVAVTVLLTAGAGVHVILGRRRNSIGVE